MSCCDWIPEITASEIAGNRAGILALVGPV